VSHFKPAVNCVKTLTALWLALALNGQRPRIINVDVTGKDPEAFPRTHRQLGIVAYLQYGGTPEPLGKHRQEMGQLGICRYPQPRS
jgi:hypothetical protein